MTTTHAPTPRADRHACAAPRVDLYGPIHKALRHFMLNTLLRVGQIDVFDAEDVERTLGQLEALLAQCAAHLDHENRFVHAAIEARRPGGSQRIAGEHEDHLRHIAALRDEAHTLHAAPADARMVLALHLYHHLALFVADNFQHMHVEETEHNAALWAHYSDEELEQLHANIMAHSEPKDMLQVARWMLPALSPIERAGMLNAARQQMPPEAFEGVIEYVRPHLDTKAWEQATLVRSAGA